MPGRLSTAISRFDERSPPVPIHQYSSRIDQSCANLRNQIAIHAPITEKTLSIHPMVAICPTWQPDDQCRWSCRCRKLLVLSRAAVETDRWAGRAERCSVQSMNPAGIPARRHVACNTFFNGREWSRVQRLLVKFAAHE